jgi:hypothetical protein
LLMDWYTVCWLAWGGAFLLIEGRALVSKTPGATLSDHVWGWFRVRDPRPTKAVVGARVGLGVFLLWLLLHMTMGWFTLSDPVPW